MLRIAPHLVSPMECVIPTVRSLKRGRMAFAFGLALNQLVMIGQNRHLRTSHRIGSGGIIPTEMLAERAPGIAMKGVTGGARWYDACMTSGERLALAFALSAKETGANVLNHVEVEEGLIERGRIVGVAARDRITGESLELAADVVVDCRGVGRSCDPTNLGDRDSGIEFVKAVNIVGLGRRVDCAVGAPTRDKRGNPESGRLIFACPNDQTTVVGTWYFPFRSSSEEITPGELDEILPVVNGAFPGWQVTLDDIVGQQVGFQPRAAMTASELQPIERPLLTSSASRGGIRGLWQLQTEKWTTVRALAQLAVTRLARDEKLPAAPSRTAEQSLAGGGWPVTLTPDQSSVLRTLHDEQAMRIKSHYGSRLGLVLDYFLKDPRLAEPVPGVTAITKGEVFCALDHEMARTTEDIIRRTSLGETSPLAPDTIGSLDEYIARQGIYQSE